MALTITRKVSVTGGTVLRAANNLGDVDSFASARANLGVYSQAEVAAQRNGLAPRPGIISTGASAVGTTQDNTGLAFGTGDLSIGVWARLPDWTPAAQHYFVDKLTATLGVSLELNTTGTLGVRMGNGASLTAYSSTVATGIADGAWGLLVATLDRDGNAVFYVNGAALGDPVSIAAQSAQTLTSTAALTYFGVPTVGTLGETFIISGLLTATNVADIYKAGSIAPFAASFTFFTWPAFDQGYGPILKDRSGQNQPALMGTSGLTHAVPRNPPGVPQRAPRVAIVGDGSSGGRGFSTLGAQKPLTGARTAWLDVVLPSTVATGGLFGFGANSASVGTGNSFALESQSGLVYEIFGASIADRIERRNAALTTLLAGERVVLASTWDGTTFKIFAGYKGDFFDISALFSDTNFGSPPTWGSALVGTYAVFGGGPNGGLPLSVFDLRLANFAMTEAQLRTEYEAGEPGPEWQGASRVNQITSVTRNSDFSAGATDWAGASGGSVAVSGSKLDVTCPSASAGATLASAYGGGMIQGRSYRVTFDISNNPGLNSIGVRVLGIVSSFTTTANNTTVTGVVTALGTQGLAIVAQTGAYNFTIDNVIIEPLGYTSRLRTDTAAGLTALDGSSNKNDFLLSTTGVTTSPNGRRQIIRPGTLTFTSPGTLNLQMFGASVVDTTKKWRIVSFSGTANGAANISLGNVSAGAQYVSAKAVTAADFDTTDAQFVTRILSTANLWVKSDATVTLTDVMVILEQTN